MSLSMYVRMYVSATCIPHSLKSSSACADIPQPDTSKDRRVGMRCDDIHTDKKMMKMKDEWGRRRIPSERRHTRQWFASTTPSWDAPNISAFSQDRPIPSGLGMKKRSGLGRTLKTRSRRCCILPIKLMQQKWESHSTWLNKQAHTYIHTFLVNRTREKNNITLAIHSMPTQHLRWYPL